MLANAAAEQMFGYRAAEMIGKSLHELLPNRFHEQHQQQVNESVSTGVITRALNAIGITSGLRANGEEFPVEASISQISVDAEKMYTVILRDITERKQYEEQLHALNAELENRVAERTLELNRTNIELEHANKAKDEFLATMSHELRTPLNSILGLSESLLEEKRGPLNAYQQHALGIIGSSGQHLLELINDILDLSKIDAGKFDYYPQEVSVDEVCRTSMAFIKEQAVRKSITILYNNEAAISRISADPRRLKQILVNLLSNAVKFTPEKGTVTLEVTGNVLAEVIHFSVIDTGIGIAPDDLQKLFQPFVQVDSQLNRQYAGTGLGLALVQKLTDLQGGSVEVESELGRGSRFTINLPYRQDKIEPAASQAPQPVQPIAGIGSQIVDEEKNIVILLAEDNPSNILTLKDYLESYGHKILTAHDGAEAIEIAAATHPDLILMDIQMPVMDGLDAIRHLRAKEYSSSVPIIALTALAMPGDRERCLEAGANEYISKPVSLKILRQKIMSLLKK
jgi:PAS domain S-box-containing protein